MAMFDDEISKKNPIGWMNNLTEVGEALRAKIWEVQKLMKELDALEEQKKAIKNQIVRIGFDAVTFVRANWKPHEIRRAKDITKSQP